MEESQSRFPGRITLERVRDTRPIRSFITKRLGRWLESHGVQPAADQQPIYEVALNRHGNGHLFTCKIEVHTPESHWEAIVTEADLHQSILSALNHLAVQRRIYDLVTA